MKTGLAPLDPGTEHVELPPELSYLSPGDVIAVSPDGIEISVLWRTNSHQNSVLITEQCDNYCLMCSQPPKTRDDMWLLQRAENLIELLPADTPEVILTGGEPTIFGADFLRLLARCTARLPTAEVHILSNGRRFEDATFAESYARAAGSRVMVGIPLYGAEPSLHDYVVQAHGAFDETVLGILNLIALDQRVELRVVVHKQTAPELIAIAEFIRRNLPFVEQVAFMGLEMTGLARPNVDLVWIDPHEYQHDLSRAVRVLDVAGVHTMIYNHPLCLLEPSVRKFAVKSISDWKSEFLPECHRCAARDDCGGLFSSSSFRRSPHIRALSNPRRP